MSPTAPDIAVVIVNYGTADLAIAAVESVLSREHGGRRVEVHIVDNASPGDDAKRLEAARHDRMWGDSVVLHLEGTNHGFGRGNNLVFERLARLPKAPEKVFLLNPDACLDNEAISILADFLDTHPKVAAAGAAITLPDGTAVTAAFRFFSLAGELERTMNLGPVSRALARWRVPLPAAIATQQVDWVTGAAVMFRFEAIREVGFFDPAYFLYYEEVDLMRALALRGWQTWFVAEAHAVHHEGAATGVGPKSARHRRPPYVYRSWRHYFVKNHGRAYAIAAALAGIAGGSLQIVVGRLCGREVWLPRKYFLDVVRHVIGPILAGQDRPRSAPDVASEATR